jgi:hypothetical protein
MIKKHVITLSVLTELPGLSKQLIAEAITQDLNARGIILESLMIEEVKDVREPVSN